MFECKGSCIFTGVGKSGFVAKKVSPPKLDNSSSRAWAVFFSKQREPLMISPLPLRPLVTVSSEEAAVCKKENQTETRVRQKAEQCVLSWRSLYYTGEILGFGGGLQCALRVDLQRNQQGGSTRSIHSQRAIESLLRSEGALTRIL